MLQMDAVDALLVNKVDALLARAHQKHAQVLMFAHDFDKLGMVAASFPTKIALCGAPEGFVSSICLYTNEALSLPKVSMQALCERTDASGGLVVNSMWLFNY